VGLQKGALALNEVAGILRRINEDKREADRAGEKRKHDFFIPSGSKILVGSYVHLRREGLDGYVADFNNMVREVKSVTGDIGIEVLPVVPVCYEGVDKLGQELLGGLRMWVNWISMKSGRIEIMVIGQYCETGESRRGNDDVSVETTFMLLQSCRGEA
jgi:hypothetical protein